MNAAPTTRLARSLRSVPKPKTTTVTKRVTTPLPTSSQLTRIIGASTSKPNACVAFNRRCQAIQLTSVVTPAIAKRRRERAQGQTARTAAASSPATMAETKVTDTLYIRSSPPTPQAEADYCYLRYTHFPSAERTLSGRELLYHSSVNFREDPSTHSGE